MEVYGSYDLSTALMILQSPVAGPQAPEIRLDWITACCGSMANLARLSSGSACNPYLLLKLVWTLFASLWTSQKSPSEKWHSRARRDSPPLAGRGGSENGPGQKRGGRTRPRVTFLSDYLILHNHRIWALSCFSIVDNTIPNQGHVGMCPLAVPRQVSFL